NSFFFSSRRRHTRSKRDWSSDVCSSDLARLVDHVVRGVELLGVASDERIFLVVRGGSVRAEVVPERQYTHRGYRPGEGEVHCQQIGRASCRERVWIVGGGGIVKRVGVKV